MAARFSDARLLRWKKNLPELVGTEGGATAAGLTARFATQGDWLFTGDMSESE